MKKHHVYELINLYGSVEYVGETINPQRRFREHTRTKPNDKNTNGQFYGRQDLVINVVSSFDNRKEAMIFEGKLKLEYGMPWHEKVRDILAGNKNVENGHLDKIRKIRVDKYSDAILAYKLDGTFVGEYPSLSECGRQLNLFNIGNVLKGKQKYDKGYTFKYKEI
jgi:predicted GIY-YIG superfamily endonuclease